MAKEKKVEKMPYKKLLAKIRWGLAQPEITEDGLNSYIRKNGWTQEEFDKATVNHATIQAKKSSPKSYWGTIKGYMREVLDGVTIGYSDTVDKYLGAILDSDIDIIGDGSRKESFFSEDNLEYQKQLIAQERADYQKEFPVHSTIGNIGGAMLTGGALTKGALTMLPRLAPSAQGINIAGKAIPASATNLGKDVALNTALGTGEGALYAYNKGQDVSEGAEFGGTAGAGTSLAVRALLNNPVSKAVGRFGQGVKEAVFPSKATPREQSLERILEDWELDGVDPIERLQRLKDLGLGEEARTAYLGKYNTQQTAKDAVNTRGKARVEVKDNLLEDMERNRTLTTGQMKEGLGFNDKGESLLKGDIIDEMKKQADPLYKEAFELPPINNPDLDRVLKTIDDTTGGDFYANAKKIAEREIELLPDELRSSAILPDEMPYGNVPVAVVDYVKQSVDDLIKSAKGNDRRTLIALKKKMLDIVDVETQIKAPTNNLDPSGRPLDPNTGTPQVDPATGQVIPAPQSLVKVGESPYAKARAIYSEGHSNLEAYDLGKKAYSNKSATEIQYEIDGLSSEAEKDLYRLGASTEAVTKLNLSTADTTNASKKLLSPEAKDKHKVLFADPAKAEQFTNRLTALSGIHKSASAMLPKSDTGATNVRLFAKNMADFVSAGGSLVKRAGVIGARKLTDTVQRKQALARNEEMGKLQMAKGDKKIAGIIDETEGLKKKKEKEFSQSLINRSLLTGALTNTEAQMLGTGGLLQ